MIFGLLFLKPRIQDADAKVEAIKDDIHQNGKT